MPSGRYRIVDRPGTEDFRAAPGPSGWRWVSTIARRDAPAEVVDLSVAASGRPVRVRIENGSHALLLNVRGDTATGILDGERIDWPLPEQATLEYPSPCFTVAALTARGPGEAETVAIDPVTLEPRTVTRRFEATGPGSAVTPAGTFETQDWVVETGGRPERVRVAGIVVIEWEGRWELATYEAGATGPRPR